MSTHTTSSSASTLSDVRSTPRCCRPGGWRCLHNGHLRKLHVLLLQPAKEGGRRLCRLGRVRLVVLQRRRSPARQSLSEAQHEDQLLDHCPLLSCRLHLLMLPGPPSIVEHEARSSVEAAQLRTSPAIPQQKFRILPAAVLPSRPGREASHSVFLARLVQQTLVDLARCELECSSSVLNGQWQRQWCPWRGACADCTFDFG